MNAVPTWDEYVRDNLLQSNLFCGACMLSQHEEMVYSHGQLCHLSQEDAGQFLTAFKTTSQASEEAVVQRGFAITRQGHSREQFKVYSKTFSNIYCTSSDNRLGLTVNKLPYGVLVCLYAYPITAVKAVKQVELFCEKLRL